jgi:hypothetical protein
LVCCNYVCVLILVHGVLCDRTNDEMWGTDWRHWVSVLVRCAVVWRAGVTLLCSWLWPALTGVGGLGDVVKEGVKDLVGEEGVFVIELVIVRGFFVYVKSF